MKPLQKVKFLLCQSDFTISELCDETGVDNAACWRYLKKQVAECNVRIVAQRHNRMGKPMNVYTWDNDFDLGYLTIVAANLLSGRNDEAGRVVASRIFAAMSNV
jgi:hypothetical protein